MEQLAVQLLFELGAFIESLPGTLYQAEFSNPTRSSSIGKHVRHCLDHFDLLQSGLKTGFVDYDQRARDENAERDPESALLRIARLTDWLSAPDPESLRNPGNPLLIRAMVAVDLKCVEIPSTFERELHFVTTHLTHHMGMIRVLAELKGQSVHQNFGKAISTQEYECQRNLG